MTTVENFPTAYTPLESLLLFQALRADGVQSISFNRISDQLNNIPLIRNDPNYDSGRLSPDALRELYLRLLKDEAKQDLEQQAHGDATITNGGLSPGSRKRKLASPTLPTVHEAAQHSHLIPQLVTRLYARYRDHVVRNIREQERKHAALTREIEEIEAGQLDEQLQRQRDTFSTPTSKPASTAHNQTLLTQSERSQSQLRRSTASPATVSEIDTRPANKRYSQVKIDAFINRTPEAEDIADGHRRNSSNTTLPPLAEVAPQSPRIGAPSKGSSLVPSSMPPNTGAALNNSSQSAGHQSPYSQQIQTRPSSSPRILPLPTGASGAPVQPNGSPSSHASAAQAQPYPQQPYQPQHHGPTAPPPSQDVASGGWMPTQLPAQGGYYQQQAYHDRRTSTPSQQQYPNYSGQAHHAGGYVLSPFPVASQDPSKPAAHQQPFGQQMPAQGSHAPLYASHAHGTPATAPRNAPRQTSRLVSNVLAALATPTRQPLWKSDIRPSTRTIPTLQPRPDVEPLSPTLGRRKLGPRVKQLSDGSDRHTLEGTPQTDSEPKTRSSRRRQPARDRSPHSVVSSAADESARTRTRSHSVSTAIGLNTTFEDRPASRSGVKAEPSTPADDVDLGGTPTATTPASSGPMTRKRRGTIPPAPATTSKRKRQESPATTDLSAEHLSTPPPRSDKVVATRNFAKIASAILNDINSHKHAYHFEKPVRDRDAAGYSEIVYAPQNLKSIRAALSAGAKVVSAAAAAESPSHGDSTTLELDRSLDVLPPKAIVNAAQLEREVMRMFANAFMFNPGEDGMAGDTREFFRDVEERLSEWRDTEREIVSGGGAEEEERGKGSAKRRKV